MNTLSESGNRIEASGVIKKIFAFREIGLLLIITVFIIVMSFASDFFLQWSNIKVLLGSFSIDGIVVVGMTIILISGGIDLSVGQVLCLGMTVCSRLYADGMNPWVAALVALLVCIGIGFAIGILVTKFKLSHFIVTLCFMGIARGLNLITTRGMPISLISIMGIYPAFTFLGQGQIGGFFPMTVLIFIIVVVVAEFFVRNSAMMRRVFYTGSSEQAAIYSGIDTNKIKLAACVLSSFLAGCAGILYMNKFGGAQLTAGNGLELIAIASAVIGGASLTGGRGTILGAVLGITLIALVQNAMTLFVVPPFWQDLIRYLIVLIAVFLDNMQHTRRIRMQQ